MTKSSTLMQENLDGLLGAPENTVLTLVSPISKGYEDVENYFKSAGVRVYSEFKAKDCFIAMLTQEQADDLSEKEYVEELSIVKEGNPRLFIDPRILPSS